MSAAGGAPGRVLRAKLAACFDLGRSLPACPARRPPDGQPYPPAPPPRLPCLLQQVVSTVIGSTIALMGGWLVLPWYGSTRMLADQAAALRAAAALPRRCGRVDRRGVPRWSGLVCGGWLVPSGPAGPFNPTPRRTLSFFLWGLAWRACMPARLQLHRLLPHGARRARPARWPPESGICLAEQVFAKQGCCQKNFKLLNRAGARVFVQDVG